MTNFKCEQCDREFKLKDALDMHNKAKHPEVYKEPILSNKLKKRLRPIGIGIIVILLIWGVFYMKSIALKDAPIIEITPSSYSFGTVRQTEGTVSAELTITNKGKSDLIIDNMDTSCGCTSASIIANGIEGPKFSMAMHGTNPKNWEQIVLPGESVQLKVYYNPNVHKELRGKVTRAVFIFSNDPKHKKMGVTIDAYQTA